MRIDKGHGMEECAADSRESRDLRRVLRQFSFRHYIENVGR